MAVGTRKSRYGPSFRETFLVPMAATCPWDPLTLLVLWLGWELCSCGDIDSRLIMSIN